MVDVFPMGRVNSTAWLINLSYFMRPSNQLAGKGPDIYEVLRCAKHSAAWPRYYLLVIEKFIKVDVINPIL